MLIAARTINIPSRYPSPTAYFLPQSHLPSHTTRRPSTLSASALVDVAGTLQTRQFRTQTNCTRLSYLGRRSWRTKRLGRFQSSVPIPCVKTFPLPPPLALNSASTSAELRARTRNRSMPIHRYPDDYVYAPMLKTKTTKTTKTISVLAGGRDGGKGCAKQKMRRRRRRRIWVFGGTLLRLGSVSVTINDRNEPAVYADAAPARFAKFQATT
ncbi:hypothetical protein ONZ45_g12099 [Pleurotus djamor]|nr:hypothetical protein ONZ45_g12099 [Pleurotus djamor]